MTKILETITGGLLSYKRLEPGSMLSALQLTDERRTHPDEKIRDELRRLSFYTSDGIIYYVEDNAPKIAITTELHNLMLRHLDDALQPLTKGDNYVPDPAEAETAIHAQDTLRSDLGQMRLTDYDEERSFLSVSTVNYGKKLNPVERRIVERIFGQGKDLNDNMEMLRDAGYHHAKIWVLNPIYVLGHAKSGSIARASWLDSFGDVSQFSASDCGVDLISRVRGVRKKTDNDQFSAQKFDNSSDFLRRSASADYRFPTREEILTSLQPHIPPPLWAGFVETIPPQAQTYGDILQKAVEGKYLCATSERPFKKSLRKLFPRR